jgi:hypothetical protein
MPALHQASDNDQRRARRRPKRHDDVPGSDLLRELLGLRTGLEHAFAGCGCLQAEMEPHDES